MSDFIPTGDADFTVWMQNFIAYANSNLAALGLTLRSRVLRRQREA